LKSSIDLVVLGSSIPILILLTRLTLYIKLATSIVNDDAVVDRVVDFHMLNESIQAD
jgi:hypothetical protein